MDFLIVFKNLDKHHSGKQSHFNNKQFTPIIIGKQ